MTVCEAALEASRKESQQLNTPQVEPAAPPLRANSLRTGPNERGRFGEFGGRFVAETLMPLILEVERAYDEAKADPAFQPNCGTT